MRPISLEEKWLRTVYDAAGHAAAVVGAFRGDAAAEAVAEANRDWAPPASPDESAIARLGEALSRYRSLIGGGWQDYTGRWYSLPEGTTPKQADTFCQAVMAAGLAEAETRYGVRIVRSEVVEGNTSWHVCLRVILPDGREHDEQYTPCSETWRGRLLRAAKESDTR